MNGSEIIALFFLSISSAGFLFCLCFYFRDIFFKKKLDLKNRILLLVLIIILLLIAAETNSKLQDFFQAEENLGSML